MKSTKVSKKSLFNQVIIYTSPADTVLKARVNGCERGCCPNTRMNGARAGTRHVEAQPRPGLLPGERMQSVLCERWPRSSQLGIHHLGFQGKERSKAFHSFHAFQWENQTSQSHTRLKELSVM